jgi:Sap, sulfolipid-1-addressing protein
MNLQILPLAITMMAGPQIMAAIIFVTAPKALRVSVPFLAGVSIATAVGVIITTLNSLLSLGDSSDSGSTGHIIQYVLVGLLVTLAVKTYLGRETAEPPGWLGALQSADAKRAFMTGLLVILLMPSDIIMFTVGVNLAQNNAGLVAALPFIGARVLVAALPLIFFLVFHRRAQQSMLKVRDWMNTHSWLVNIIVCGVFIALILL